MNAGGVQDRLTEAFPPFAVSPVGAPGTVTVGLGVADASPDCGEVPTALTAATL